MYSFSANSRQRLETCDDRLQRVLTEAIKHIDFTVVCGHRTKEEQNLAFNTGKSKLQFPRSRHNSYPSKAVDIAPYPIDWSNRERFYFLAGIVLGIAASMGIKLRYGGDWDGDGDITDNTFDDLVHFEIVEG